MMLTSVNVGECQDEHEGGQDRDAGDEQRQQGQERRVHEEQHQQCRRASQQGLDQDARAFLLTSRGQQAVGGQAAFEACCLGGLGQCGVELGLDLGAEGHRDRSLDQGVRRAPVVGHEALGRLVLAKSTTRSFTSGTAATAVEMTPATASAVLLDRLTLRHGHDGDVGVVGAHAVGVDELLLGVVAGLAGQREVQRPAVAERADRDHAADEQCATRWR